MDIRRVQQVGYSTLTVSLPSEWVREVGLKKGGVVYLRKEEDGSLRLQPGTDQRKGVVAKCIVDSDKCTASGLLTRVITGLYITGHDTILIKSKREFREGHLEEVRRTTQRLTGINIVEQTLRTITLQSFVDPTRFPVDGLLKRLSTIISTMQQAAFQSREEWKPEYAAEAPRMESEVDRIYWLIVRQLLLASRDRDVAKKIGVDSPLHIVGDRVIAKAFESIGDHMESIASEVLKLMNMGTEERGAAQEIVELGKKVQHVYENAVKSFFSRDVSLANAAIEEMEEVEGLEKGFTQHLFKQIQSPQLVGKGRRIAAEILAHTIIWDLAHIARHCGTIAEISINRYLEQGSEVCQFEEAKAIEAAPQQSEKKASG